MLIISIHDTLRSLGIYFRLFANSVHDTKYHKQRSLAHYLRSWNSIQTPWMFVHTTMYIMQWLIH